MVRSISSVSPSSVSPGGSAMLTITGVGFEAESSVEIGESAQCDDVTVVAANQITCTTPALAEATCKFCGNVGLG